jgi:phenylalanine-4-hydroxylase
MEITLGYVNGAKWDTIPKYVHHAREGEEAPHLTQPAMRDFLQTRGSNFLMSMQTLEHSLLMRLMVMFVERGTIAAREHPRRWSSCSTNSSRKLDEDVR